MGKQIDLTGKIFTRLTVVRFDKIGKNRKKYWLCKCLCGNEILVTTSDLNIGNSKSCGCYKLDKITKHGYYLSLTYQSWEAMISRCNNKNHIAYCHYGGKGITVCERWVNDFRNFLKDMGERPSKEHSLDRFPNKDGNYEPNNVRWATPHQQQNNRTNNIILEYNSIKMTMANWARFFKINRCLICYHLKKGKSFQEIALYFTNKLL